jgi:hypothetical protein
MLLTPPSEIEATCRAHRTVLLQQYETARKQYAEAVDELDRKVALLPNAEYSKLCLDAENGRVECERLRMALCSGDRPFTPIDDDLGNLGCGAGPAQEGARQHKATN